MPQDVLPAQRKRVNGSLFPPIGAGARQC